MFILIGQYHSENTFFFRQQTDYTLTNKLGQYPLLAQLVHSPQMVCVCVDGLNLNVHYIDISTYQFIPLYGSYICSRMRSCTI